MTFCTLKGHRLDAERWPFELKVNVVVALIVKLLMCGLRDVIESKTAVKSFSFCSVQPNALHGVASEACFGVLRSLEAYFQREREKVEKSK